MKRLIIIADIHGLYTAWQNIFAILQPEDILVVAGDLFDNRYGDKSSYDYQPEKVREGYLALPNEKYYVYGNCDLPEFFPDQKQSLIFSFQNKHILLHHDETKTHPEADTIIFGHTHVPTYYIKHNITYINPGSMAKPKISKNNLLARASTAIPTYMVWEGNKLNLLEAGTNKSLWTTNLPIG